MGQEHIGDLLQLDVEIIANMIEHQRRDQESLFRSLTSGMKTRPGNKRDMLTCL